VRSRHWRLAPLEPDVPSARAYPSAISSIRVVLILGLIGIFEMKGAIGSHRMTAAPIVWLVLSLLAGAGMGAVRGATVRISGPRMAWPGGRERCSLRRIWAKRNVRG
jgi:hypothetical protein